MLTKVKRSVRFVTRDVWDVDVCQYPRRKRYWLRVLKVLLLTGHGFDKDECALRASSLTFISLISIMPVLALTVSVAGAVMDIDVLRTRAKDAVHRFIATTTEIPLPVPATSGAAPSTAEPAAATSAAETPESVTEASAGSPEPTEAEPIDSEMPVASETPSTDSLPQAPAPVAAEPPPLPPSGISESQLLELVDKAFDAVAGIHFKALGIIGSLVILWAVISVIGNIERCFNYVWRITKPRSFLRKLRDYLFVCAVIPFLGALAGSIPILSRIEAEAVNLEGAIERLPILPVGPVLRVVWTLLILTLAFTMLLRFLPNTTVRFRPALAGGAFSAVAFAVWFKICLSLQIGVAKYSAIFGSFALVPILLFWVYVTWQILLIGAEISHAVQNVDAVRPREA